MTIRHRDDPVTPHRPSELTTATAEVVITATLIVKTSGQGFTEITADAARFIAAAGARDGALLLYLRHTSASLVIQENADPAVRADLATALDRLAPPDQPWLHHSEGPDDMPSHVKTMLTGVSLHVPVADGALLLGHYWQGIYLIGRVSTWPSTERRAAGARSCCSSSERAVEPPDAMNARDGWSASPSFDRTAQTRHGSRCRLTFPPARIFCRLPRRWRSRPSAASASA